MDSKRTKRVRDASEELTLDEHIGERRGQLVQAREEAPVLRERGRLLRVKADALTGRWQRRAAADLREAAAELEEEASVREGMSREHTFESTIVCYLRMYHQRGSESMFHTSKKKETVEAYVRHVDLTQQHRANIMDEYLCEMHRAPPKVAMAARDECPRCDPSIKLLLCSARSIMSCPDCGYTVTYLDATSTSTAFDEVVEYSQYSYKRINHYLMHLSLAQGKEAHRVPDDILNAVMNDLYARQNVRQPEQITQKRVRDSLRKLRLRKAYDHVAQVTSRLSGLRPPRIPRETEDKLKNMFLQMQPAFQRHAPKTRTNFLSYSYILYRCFQILGLPHMLDGISLLKGRDKLEANDAIFRKMCEDLGWPVFDLPPATETMG